MGASRNQRRVLRVTTEEVVCGLSWGNVLLVWEIDCRYLWSDGDQSIALYRERVRREKEREHVHTLDDSLCCCFLIPLSELCLVFGRGRAGCHCQHYTVTLDLFLLFMVTCC